MKKHISSERGYIDSSFFILLYAALVISGICYLLSKFQIIPCL